MAQANQQESIIAKPIAMTIGPPESFQGKNQSIPMVLIERALLPMTMRKIMEVFARGPFLPTVIKETINVSWRRP